MRRASHDSIRVDVMAEVGRRIFIACEGYRTEVEYFTTICRNRRRYGITDPVDIVVLNRLRTNVGDSDPDAVLRLTREYLGFLTTGVCRIGLFLNYIQDRMEVSEGLRGAIIGCLETNGLIIDGDVVDVPQAQSKVEEMLASIGYNISIGIINQTPYMD